MHKKGMMVVIAVGAGKPAPNGKTCKGKDMIKVPMEALIAETEEGSDVSPEVGSTVVLESVEGTVREINILSQPVMAMAVTGWAGLVGLADLFFFIC